MRDDNGNVPLSGHNKCVSPSDCNSNGQFLSITEKECINDCADNQYLHSDGNACKECKTASDKMEFCTKCYYDSTDSVVKCKECSSNYL